MTDHDQLTLDIELDDGPEPETQYEPREPLPPTSPLEERSTEEQPEVLDPVHVSDRDDTFDRTALTANTHGFRVHRDYASHYFRWGWATRQIQQFRKELGEAPTVLDVGGGVDMPLARVLSTFMHSVPKRYVAVELNKVAKPFRAKWIDLSDSTDFTDIEVQRRLWRENDGPFDLIVNFEVIEHMVVEKGAELLSGFQRLLKPGTGRLLLSTPVFNGKAAKNHIHEYRIDELQQAIEAAGLEVVKRYGTFVSYHDAKRGLAEWAERTGNDAATALALFEDLREFYSDDVTACFGGPVMADHARNNVWVCRRPE